MKSAETDSFFAINLIFVQAFSYINDPFLIPAVIGFEEVHGGPFDILSVRPGMSQLLTAKILSQFL